MPTYTEVVLSSSAVSALIAFLTIVVKDILTDDRKKRDEYQKAHRRVLYLLLEMRHTIRPMLIDAEALTHAYCVKVTDRLILKCKERGIATEPLMEQDSLSVENDENFQKILLGYFESILESAGSSIEKNFLDEYDSALNQLSEQNPLIAFKLKGREKVEGLIHTTNKYIEQFKLYMGDTELCEETRHANAQAIEKAQAKKARQIVEFFDEDIMLVADACGRKLARHSQEHLKRTSSIEPEDIISGLDTDIDDFFETYIQLIIESHNAAIE